MKKILLLVLACMAMFSVAPVAKADVILLRHHRHHYIHPGEVWVPAHRVGPWWHRHYVSGHWAAD